MEAVFSLFGDWTWVVIAIVLLILELLISGIFLIWLGLAAAAVALLNFQFDFSWQAELALFAVFSAVFVVIGRPIIRKWLAAETDQPNLNRRLDNYIGRRYVLEKPIVDGLGQLRIEDTIWEIKGPDTEAGTMVKVAATEGMSLVVEAVADQA